MSISSKKIILFAALLLIFGALNAQALEITAGASAPPPNDFLSYAKFLYPFALSVAAVLAVIMIIIAGLEMMTASEGLREDAKKKIWGAVLGLLLAVGSFLILRTINPQLINLRLTPPTVSVPGDVGPIGLPCTGLSDCAPAGRCNILPGKSVGICELIPGLCTKPGHCPSRICNIPGGSNVGTCSP